jgi:hypothetical protein
MRTPGVASINCIAACAALLCACEPTPKLPLTGNITFQYQRSVKSELHFKLANQTAGHISFRGTRDGSAALPWDTLFECKGSDDFWTEEPYGLVDGERAIVELPPGTQVDLIVDGEFAQQFAAGRCRLGLRLESGAWIESAEFQPI